MVLCLAPVTNIFDGNIFYFIHRGMHDGEGTQRVVLNTKIFLGNGRSKKCVKGVRSNNMNMPTFLQFHFCVKFVGGCFKYFHAENNTLNNY